MEVSSLAPAACIEKLELWSATLTFLGGAFLIVDTFSPVREVLLEGGRKKWEWASARLGLRPKTVTPAPPPQNDPMALRRAHRSQFITRMGFGLITLGFLLDLMAKLRWSFVFDLMAKLHRC
jgi:hypothetical protein